ncbi:MAG: tetraacyldisaccharide 4'-kinase [Rhodocyclaceae bacterium]|nr:MAG: tetraacyldisaccharide 4'-kinase [Rhodocyclaceae bacterium]
MQVSSKLQNAWHGRGLLTALLLPVSGIFALSAGLRRALYRLGILQSQHLPVPVVVVGNITVGGSGKTPLTLWLAQEFQQRGWHPGIISRGHGREIHSRQVSEVRADSEARQVGDEPLMLKRRSGLPLFVGQDRVAAAWALLAIHPECDLILSDDGLQHYRLARDVEIAVVDARGLMNGRMLPAGPLREPAGRLRHVDALVLNGPVKLPASEIATFQLELHGTTFYSLADPTKTCTAFELRHLNLAAIAGIGVPQRFFDHLTGLGLNFAAHAFPDHHRYRAGDLSSIRADALLMTEKDAVKCSGLTERPVWVMPVTAQVTAAKAGSDLATHVEQCILEKPHGRPPA